MQETQEMQVWSLGQEDPLEKGMATHSNILAWIIPWTKELVGYSPWGCKELDMTEASKQLFRQLAWQWKSMVGKKNKN